MNPKGITIAALIGFVLSFFIGLISDVSFGIMLLRAVIFAAIFGGLAAGIFLLFDKYLSGNNSTVDVPAESVSSNHTGSVVDITIDDEPLPDDGDGPDFNISNTSNTGNISPISDSSGSVEDVTASEESVKEDTQVASSGEPAFTPVKLGQTAEKVQQDIPEESLDVLPDISDIPVNLSADQNSVLEDTDFALGGTGDDSVSSAKSTGNAMDAETIAKAIKTVLSKDS